MDERRGGRVSLMLGTSHLLEGGGSRLMLGTSHLLEGGRLV